MKKSVQKKKKSGYEGGMMEPGSSADFKTGNWKTLKPVYDKKKCINCMLCVVYCPENCILQKKGIRLETNYDMCKGCGICAQVCPVKAIRMVKEDEDEDGKD